MGQRAAARNGRSRRRSRRNTGRRRPTGPILLLGVCLALMSVGAGAALAHWRGGPPPAEAADGTDVAPLMSQDPAPEPSASPSPSPSAGSSPKPKPKPSPSPSAKSEPPSVPASGPGTFTVAQSSGTAAGTGTLRRYKVEVEDGIDVSAQQAAAEIQQILAHPRGWAANGRGRFQLVSSNADFVIRIATPATADKLCLAVGLNTRGELNCETTEGVVVNLRRWLLGSPTFAGTPAEYRHLIINHEVGHEIGIRQHMGCPGPGEPAPVMMQQIKGLKGCVSNAWPYDDDGTYLSGPPV
ncbi:DUF3152 domain-containing protein [Streptomyces kurssanovii]|uniref:DUF3152 domain-containing protein n=1 Tax=Streptomyces kurssanovii TaxID=67312 RepID=A0ABV3HMS9_9ACTN